MGVGQPPIPGKQAGTNPTDRPLQKLSRLRSGGARSQQWAHGCSLDTPRNSAGLMRTREGKVELEGVAGKCSTLLIRQSGEPPSVAVCQKGGWRG